MHFNFFLDAERKIAFLGKKGFDIFGKSTFFAPLIKWETLQKDVNGIKAAAETYEKAFNNVIDQQSNQQNFQQVRSPDIKHLLWLTCRMFSVIHKTYFPQE